MVPGTSAITTGSMSSTAPVVPAWWPSPTPGRGEVEHAGAAVAEPVNRNFQSWRRCAAGADDPGRAGAVREVRPSTSPRHARNWPYPIGAPASIWTAIGRRGRPAGDVLGGAQHDHVAAIGEVDHGDRLVRLGGLENRCQGDEGLGDAGVADGGVEVVGDCGHAELAGGPGDRPAVHAGGDEDVDVGGARGRRVRVPGRTSRRRGRRRSTRRIAPPTTGSGRIPECASGRGVRRWRRHRPRTGRAADRRTPRRPAPRRRRRRPTDSSALVGRPDRRSDAATTMSPVARRAAFRAPMPERRPPPKSSAGHPRRMPSAAWIARGVGLVDVRGIGGGEPQRHEVRRPLVHPAGAAGLDRHRRRVLVERGDRPVARAAALAERGRDLAPVEPAMGDVGADRSDAAGHLPIVSDF